MVKKKTMGSLYFNDTPAAVGSKYDGQELSIGDTAPGKEISWVEVNGLLIADRCICTYISAEQLDDLGFTKGKPITIDGRQYLCRLLKVGAEPDVPNEWDAALDATSDEDDLWHWEEAFFWGQEPIEDFPAGRANRGCNSARSWNNYSASLRLVRVGFRPVLEPLGPDTLNSDKPSPGDGKIKLSLSELENMSAGDRVFITAERESGFPMSGGPCLIAPIQRSDNFCAVTWATRETQGTQRKPVPGARWVELSRAKYGAIWYAEIEVSLEI